MNLDTQVSSWWEDCLWVSDCFSAWGLGRITVCAQAFWPCYFQPLRCCLPTAKLNCRWSAGCWITWQHLGHKVQITCTEPQLLTVYQQHVLCSLYFRVSTLNQAIARPFLSRGVEEELEVPIVCISEQFWVAQGWKVHCAPGWWEAEEEEEAGGGKNPCACWPRASILPAGGQVNVPSVAFLEWS